MIIVELRLNRPIFLPPARVLASNDLIQSQGGTPYFRDDQRVYENKPK